MIVKVVNIFIWTILSVFLFSQARSEDVGQRNERDDSKPPTNWKSALNSLGLLPPEDSPYGASGAGGLTRQLGRNLNEDELAVFGQGADGPWRQFSDDLVSFQVPDNKLLEVEPFTREENPQLRIVGGAVGDTDNSFQRVYRITVGPDKIPYGILFVTVADWFDDGICLCGPIVLKTFSYEDGTLLEMSQLPGGDLKKFQILNDTHRGILFEWTHSAIPQETYARIGGSLRFRDASERTLKDWKDLVSIKRGFKGKLGFLRLGMSEENAIGWLGEFQKKHEDESYEFFYDERYDDQSGYRAIFRILFDDGRLVRFRKGWSKSERLLAPQGALSWCREMVSSSNGDPFGEDDAEKIDEDTKQIILQSFLKNAVKEEKAHWEDWCQVLCDLADEGCKSEAAIKIVEEKSEVMSLGHSWTYRVLEKYDSTKQASFLLTRIKYFLETSEDAEFRHGEEHNLYVNLNNLAWDDDELRPQAEELFRGSLVHRSVSIRAAAFYILDFLPREEAYEFLKKGLSDPSENVRVNAAYDISSLCTLEDSIWLEDVLSLETDKRAKRQIEKEISQLKEK